VLSYSLRSSGNGSESGGRETDPTYSGLTVSSILSLSLSLSRLPHFLAPSTRVPGEKIQEWLFESRRCEREPGPFFSVLFLPPLSALLFHLPEKMNGYSRFDTRKPYAVTSTDFLGSHALLGPADAAVARVKAVADTVIALVCSVKRSRPTLNFIRFL